MQRRKILIVDDEFAFANYAKMILEEAGFDVVVQLEGERATETAASEQPDLILMDMHIGDVTGDEAIRRLKADGETRSIPVVLCSITKSSSEVESALREGAAGFLPKPLKIDDLKRSIAAVLGKPR